MGATRGYTNTKSMIRRTIALCATVIIVISAVGCASNEKQTNMSSLSELSGTEEDYKNILGIDKNEPLDEGENSLASEVDNEIDNESDSLTTTQLNSLNMLNYLTVLTQEINESKQSRVYLESAYSSLINNIYPNAVDSRTQSQLMNILDTLENYRMLTVKRERIEYIYEQNRAQALRKAIPNPIGLLSAVQSGSPLKIAASVLYMAVDSKNSYDSAIAQANMQYLQDGWELDDEEARGVHNSRKNAFAYMLNMVRDINAVRDNPLTGDYALNEDAVQNFVEWKNNTNNVRKIAWLETNQKTYQKFGPYWLELAGSYYNAGEYGNCLDAIRQYESVYTRIFRKDYDYAKALPMAILSSKELLSKEDYVKYAEECLERILANTDGKDITLRYYAALFYIDLCGVSGNKEYLNKAYKIVFDNINILVDKQKELNEEYLAEVKKINASDIKTDRNANDEAKKKVKREKEEAKEFNRQLKEERKVALPPVNELLYLNCDLLFSLANQMGISENEKTRINSVLHGNGEKLFLSQTLDDRYWFDNESGFNINEVEVKFEKNSLFIPATLVTDKSSVSVSIITNGGTETIEDWTVDQVYRMNKNSFDSFLVNYKSKKAKSIRYKPGDKVIITVTPVIDTPDKTVKIDFSVVEKKRLIGSSIKFERN